VVKAKLKVAGVTNPGRVRGNNEDAFHVDQERGIFLVVDGIGGQAAGEKAAEIAVARLRARLERQTGTAEQRIREAITVANNEILAAARKNPDWQGMACVLTVVVLDNGSAVFGHVGDSRLYEIRAGAIRKLTRDHSPIGEREDNRELSEEEAMRHPRRNEVFRDVGSEEHTPDDPDFIDIQRIPFEPDSALLLCSDGLSDQVTSKEIRLAVERNSDPEKAARELIDAANRAGGKDNVTVVIVEGEQFTRTVQTAELPAPIVINQRRWYGQPWLWFLLGLAMAGAGSYFSRGLWTPTPQTANGPRVLIVGGPEGEYGTIASAMAEARPGDTVEVSGGEYREQIVVKTGVTVRSRVPHEATLRAPAVGGGPAILADNVKNARVADFLIKADETTPLPQGIVLNNSVIEVDGVEVAGAAVGIQVQGEGSPKLVGNAIHDCAREGLLVLAPATPWVEHNSFQRNKAGLVAREGAKPALIGNVFDKNPVDLPPAIPRDTVREHNFFLDVPAAPRGGRK